MLKVAIIDDNKELRTRVAKRIARYLKKESINWQVKHYDPLEEKEDYSNWIVQNKVVILIVDEKLNVVPNSKGKAASYSGHDIVKLLRITNKQLPMYVITAYEEDTVLQGMKGQFDGIVSRTLFSDNKNAEQYIQRFVRATQSYLENYQEEYNRLADLSELVALDKATKENIAELKGLQTKLEIPLTSLNINDRKNWLLELESKTTKLEELSEKIKQFLSE
jgi:CheY-like chemotaxis protein